jgi:hypothetical protein
MYFYRLASFRPVHRAPPVRRHLNLKRTINLLNILLMAHLHLDRAKRTAFTSSMDYLK